MPTVNSLIYNYLVLSILYSFIPVLFCFGIQKRLFQNSETAASTCGGITKRTSNEKEGITKGAGGATGRSGDARERLEHPDHQDGGRVDGQHT